MLESPAEILHYRWN